MSTPITSTGIGERMSTPKVPGPSGGGGGPTPTGIGDAEALALLDRTIAATESTEGLHRWHPRADKLWVSRDGATYTLSVRRGAHEFRLNQRSLRQLGDSLNCPSTLLLTLRGLPNLEDCRLLNVLLWGMGTQPDWQLHAAVAGEDCQQLSTSPIVRMQWRRFEELLRGAHARSEYALRTVERHGAAWYLVGSHPLFPAQTSVAAVESGAHNSDRWQPGGSLFTIENGSHAVQAAPILIGPRHEVLILPPSLGRSRARRHAGVDGAQLAQDAMADLLATRLANFEGAVKALGRLHERYVQRSDFERSIKPAVWGKLPRHIREAMFRGIALGRPTLYRALLAGLRAANDLKDPAERWRVLGALGSLIGVRDRDPIRREGSGATGSARTPRSAGSPTRDRPSPRAGQ